MKEKIFISQFLILLFGFSLNTPSLSEALDIGTFDPIGTQLQLLNQKIPALDIRGFLLNRTDLDLHGKSNSKGAGQRAKTWDFQLIEWDAELELRYRFSSNFELVNFNHMLYDAIYDWDGGADFPKEVERELEYYHTYKQILRELYLNIDYGNWFIQLGKQQVIWGKMDGKVIDMINPDDLRESVNMDQDDYEFRRIPIWMSNISYFWGDYYLQFLWIPDFEPSRGLEPGGVWWPPGLPDANNGAGQIISKSDKPSASFLNHEWALHFNMIKNAWDISLIYFYTWDDWPTLFLRGTTLDHQNRPLLFFEPQHTRIHRLGGSVDKNFRFLNRDWVWRLETLYTINKYEYTISATDHDGVTKRNNLLTFSSFETNWWRGEIFTFFQPMWRYQFGYDGQLRTSLNNKIERSELSFILSLTKKWLDDRLVFTTTFYYTPQQGDWLFQDTIYWSFSNYFSAQIRFTGFSGHSTDLMGMYQDWDNLGFEIKYTF
jgi:hypothetical protein